MHISNVKHSNGVSANYHDQIHYRKGNNKYFDANFNFMKHFGKTWPVLGVAVTASH